MKAPGGILLAGTVSLLFAASGFAQDNNLDQSGQQSQNNSSELNASENQQNQIPDQPTVQGEINGFRHLNLHPKNGGQQTRSFLRLHLQDGRDVIVDVGQKSKLDDLNLASGDQAQVWGHYREAHGQRVLVATRIEVNGQAAEIEQQRENEHHILTGTIEGFHNLAVEGSQGEQETQTLVKLRLENGETKVLDLGPQERLSSLDLQKGDQVRVRVEQGKLDDRSIMLVNRLDDLSRGEVGNEAAGAMNAPEKEMNIRGKVRGYQVWTIQENNQPMAILDLQLQNGKSVVVGTDQYHPGEFDLRQLALGDRVDIKAHESNGKDGEQLIADSIRFNETKSGKSQEQQQSQEQQP